MKYPSLRLVFDRRKTATANKAADVQIEVMFNRQRKWLKTGIRCYSGQWDEVRQEVRMSVRGAMQANERIRLILNSLQDWVNSLIRSDIPFDFQKLKEWQTQKSYADDFVAFASDKIETRKDIRESTRKTHRKLIASLTEFKLIHYLQDLTKHNILAYDQFLHSKGYTQLTISSYHKFLKIYINEAIREGLIDNTPYLGVKIERGKPQNRKYLTENELNAVRVACLPTQTLVQTRDIFVLQAFTGLAYADLSRFDFKAVRERNGVYVLTDKRQKTDEDYYLVLLPVVMDILKRYDFVLPLVCNSQYNKQLKEIAAIAGLRNIRLSSHMARHTFAVMCLNHGTQIEVLAKMMGHADIKTTQQYAKIINTTVEKEFSRLSREFI